MCEWLFNNFYDVLLLLIVADFMLLYCCILATDTVYWPQYPASFDYLGISEPTGMLLSVSHALNYYQ